MLSEAVLWHYVPDDPWHLRRGWSADSVKCGTFHQRVGGGWPKGVNLTPYDTPAWAWGVGLGVKGTAGDQVDRCPVHDCYFLLVSWRMSGFIIKQSSEAVIWRCGRIWWVGMIKDKTRPFTFTAADSRFTEDAWGDFFRLSYLTVKKGLLTLQ